MSELKLSELIPGGSVPEASTKPIVKEDAPQMAVKEFNIDNLPSRADKEENKPNIYIDNVMEQIEKKLDDEEQEAVQYVEEVLDEVKASKFGENDEQESNETGEIESYVVSDFKDVEEPVVKPFEGIEQKEFENTEDLDEEFKDETTIDEEDQNAGEEEFNKLRDAVKARIKPVTSKLDLSTFTINAKPSSLVRLFTGDKETAIANWGLRRSGLPLHLKHFDGEEVNDIVNPSDTKTPLNSQQDVYKLIYDHEIAKDKPSFKEWLELINLEDEDDIFMAVFRAAYANANTLHRVCPECGEFHMYDFTFEQMVKYEDSESKQKMMNIMNTSLESAKVQKHDIEIVPISDELAVGLKYATLASALFDNLVLSETFREKYANKLSMLAYIDSFYKINVENHSLDPIEFKVFEGDPEKTMRYKVKVFCDIMKRLNVSQFYLLNTLIRDLSTKESIKMSYRIPECKCVKCNKEIPEEAVTAKGLLFTRHQLDVIANM